MSHATVTPQTWRNKHNQYRTESKATLSLLQGCRETRLCLGGRVVDSLLQLLLFNIAQVGEEGDEQEFHPMRS